MSDRAGRWVTEQVGRYARSVNEVALELGCDWHTVNDTVIAYGTALVDDDPDRFGAVEALGLDEVLFARVGHLSPPGVLHPDRRRRAGPAPRHRPWSQRCRGPRAWLERRGRSGGTRSATPRSTCRAPIARCSTTMVPDAVQVADPFHVVKLANTKLDECRRRVQNETMGHRGRKADPLYRCRRLLTKAEERLSESGQREAHGSLAGR